MQNSANNRRNQSDRRDEDRRGVRDRRFDRRSKERRAFMRRTPSLNGSTPHPEEIPNDLESLNTELANLTAEIDKVSAKLVSLLDRSRNLFSRRQAILDEHPEFATPTESKTMSDGKTRSYSNDQ